MEEQPLPAVLLADRDRPGRGQLVQPVPAEAEVGAAPARSQPRRPGSAVAAACSRRSWATRCGDLLDQLRRQRQCSGSLTLCPPRVLPGFPRPSSRAGRRRARTARALSRPGTSFEQLVDLVRFLGVAAPAGVDHAAVAAVLICCGRAEGEDLVERQRRVVVFDRSAGVGTAAEPPRRIRIDQVEAAGRKRRRGGQSDVAEQAAGAASGRIRADLSPCDLLEQRRVVLVDSDHVLDGSRTRARQLGDDVTRAPGRNWRGQRCHHVTLALQLDRCGQRCPHRLARLERCLLTLPRLLAQLLVRQQLQRQRRSL